MAVTATFQADFTSFNQAVQKAEVKLADFKSGADRVGPALNRMVDQFSGRKLIQEAELMTRAIELSGGAAALTGSQLQVAGAKAAEAAEKMRKMGIDVPPGLQKIADHVKGINTVVSRDLLGTLTKVAGAFGIAFSVQAVTRFVGSVFTAASTVHDMALQLGVSAEAAQRFSFAAKQTGSSTEAVGKAISFMNRELSGGDKSTVKALRDAGLEFDAIRAMRPEDAFNAIATAIKGIADPMLQAELATKLFSRSGQELLPGIKEGFVEIGNSASVMSDKTVESLERAQDAWDELAQRVTVITGNLIADSLEMVTKLKAQWDELGFFGRLKEFGPTGSILMGAASAMGILGDSTKKTRGDIELLPPVIRRTKDELDAIAATSKKSADAHEKFADSLRDIVDVLSGGGAIDKAHLYMQALSKTVDVSQMTTAAQKTLHGVLDEALLTYSRLGQVAPKAMRDAWLATAPLVPLTSEYAKTLKDVSHQLELFASDAGQGFGMQGLADGAKTVLEHTKTWRDALFDVVDVLEVVGDRWSTIAQGILRQSQAIVALWTSGSKSAAVGMTIGAAGQAIPTGTTAGKVGYGAAQGAAAGASFAAFTGGASVAIGAGIGALIGWYQSGKAARQVNDTRDAFVAAAGGLGKLNEQAVRAGTTLKAMLEADTVAEYEQAIHDLAGAFDKYSEQIETAKTEILGLGDSFNTIVAGSDDIFSRINIWSTAIDDANKSWDAAKKAGDRTKMIAADQQWLDLTAQLRDEAKAFAGQLTDLGTIALSTYAAMTEAGYTHEQSLAAMHDGLAQLRTAYEQLGLPIEDVALNVLLVADAIMTNNPALVAAAGALASQFEILNKYGLLNVGTFEAMEKTGLSMYTKLQGEAAAVGGTTRDALVPMQAFLHDAEKAAKDLGIPLDDNTQMLIDQSKELDIWKEAGKTANEILLEGIQALVDKMNEYVTSIKNAGSAIAGLPGMPSGSPSIGMAAGGSGRVTRPTLFLAGESGPEDFAFRPVGRGARGGGGGTAVLEMNGRILAEVMVPELPGAIARYGLGR